LLLTIADKILFWSGVQVSRYFGTELMRLQWGITILATLYIFSRLPASDRLFRGFRRLLAAISRRRFGAVLLCGVLPMAVRALLLPALPIASPSVHDEFSEMLLADTLASGRLTNPTHPLWQHFETIHVIQRPTYNSMYQPAFGAFLALGQKLAGNPWIGVWLAAGLMCAGICWALRGWLPPVWALTGGLAAVFTIGIPGYWMNGYMGGSVPALGGALAMGALGRLMRGLPGRKPAPSNALALGAGFALLLGSRPFEGGILGLVTAVVLVHWCRKRGQGWGELLGPRLFVPFALVMMPAVLFTGYYSWRVTTNPLKMPYEVNRETYGWPENLAILPPVHVVYRHRSMKKMHEMELSHRDVYSGFGRTVDTLFQRLHEGWEFYVGPVLTMPLLFLPLVVRDRRTRVPALIALFMCAVNVMQLMLYPQHMAAITALIFLILTQGLRHLRLALLEWRPYLLPRFAVALSVAVLLSSGLRLFAEPLAVKALFWERPYEAHRDLRAAIASKLRGRPRPQLAIVRYREDHNPNQEWVYNLADIDRSKVVWAHEMDPASNQKLLRYFRGREAWLVEADERPPRVVAYPQPAEQPTTESGPPPFAGAQRGAR
jgi:hypothetical protein